VYQPLKGWFERFAQGANLCLSLFHISELARWGDQETANAMARWYDGLPIVWAKSILTVEQEESEHWTKVAAGVPTHCVNPFASTFIGAFHRPTPDMTPGLLGKDDQVRALLDASRKKGHNKEERFMGDAAQMFRDDLDWADDNGLSADKRLERMTENEQRHVRELAQEADRRLTERGDTAYARKSCTGGHAADLLVELFRNEPRAMPYLRVQRRLWSGFGSRAHEWIRGSKNERKACASGLEDNLHACVGAAYCDLFTCDGLVAEWLGDVRVGIGKRLQMTAKGYSGGAEGFVRDLMALWDGKQEAV
jgi:hypothetical protein